MYFLALWWPPFKQETVALAPTLAALASPSEFQVSRAAAMHQKTMLLFLILQLPLWHKARCEWRTTWGSKPKRVS